MEFSLQHYILIFIIALILVPFTALSDTVGVGPVGIDSNVGVDAGATTSVTNETANDTKIDTTTEASVANTQSKSLKRYLRKNKDRMPHMKARNDSTIAPAAATDNKIEIDGRLTTTDPHLATGTQSDPPVNRPDND